jgi:hypothetical protein
MAGPGHPPDAPPLGPQGVKSAFELAWDATLPAGVPLTLRGRSWSGLASIAGVEVSTDGGASWRRAALDGPNDAGAWARWEIDWVAPPGRHELMARATDAAGRWQPAATPFNVNGYMFCAVARHPVTAIG